jgi:hypothetical protein
MASATNAEVNVVTGNGRCIEVCIASRAPEYLRAAESRFSRRVGSLLKAGESGRLLNSDLAGMAEVAKQGIESKMMEFFTKKFPALAPLVAHHELGTPLALSHSLVTRRAVSMASKRPRVACYQTHSMPVHLFPVCSCQVRTL